MVMIILLGIIGIGYTVVLYWVGTAKPIRRVHDWSTGLNK